MTLMPMLLLLSTIPPIVTLLVTINCPSLWPNPVSKKRSLPSHSFSTFTALIHLFQDMQYFPSLSALEFLYLIAKPQLSDRAWEIRFGCIDSGGDET